MKTELVHPMWNGKVEPLRPGDSIFRGTSSKFVSHDKVVSHGKTGMAPKFRRIYFSEGDEDAAGYACMTSEEYGGEPVLLEVVLTEELAARLKPGMEGLGEWYVDAPDVEVKIKHVIKCHREDTPFERCRCGKVLG